MTEKVAHWWDCITGSLVAKNSAGKQIELPPWGNGRCVMELHGGTIIDWPAMEAMFAARGVAFTHKATGKKFGVGAERYPINEKVRPEEGL